MADTTITMPAPVEGDRGAARPKRYPALIVVAHERRDAVGERLVLSNDGDRVVLGRGGTVFEQGVLDDPRISRDHLAVTRIGETLRALDQGSRNGSFKNGTRFTETPLAPGDVLRIGDLTLLFELSVRARVAPLQPNMVAASAAMVELCRELHLAATSDVTVLLGGPTGSGKEVAAREIHLKSGRAGAFVPVNCAALVESLMLSELFGHGKAAFSGADEARDGLVAAAHQGTLFLDEIGDAAPSLQSALLRLLEQREYRRVGEPQLRSTDARFVSASHVPLAQAVEDGRFRADLFSRVNRWSLTLPPLIERREDVVPMAYAFAEKRLGGPILLASELASALVRAPWPGNVRELEAVMDQAVIAARRGDRLVLSPELEARLSAAPHPLPSPTVNAARPQRPETLDELGRALAAANGNMREAALRLGVSRATIYRWLAELGASVEDLRRLVDDRRGEEARGVDDAEERGAAEKSTPP